jgi:hypothetical protein
MAQENTVISPRPIVIDAEHFSVRLLVPVVMVGLTLVFHFVGRAVLSEILSEGVNPTCVILPLDIVCLFSVGYVTERSLKRLVPSRRSATLSDDRLVITDRRHHPPQEIQVVWDKTVNVMAWRFVVRRRTRIPKGWLCMAVQLLQDEADIILYTFMSPDEAEALQGYSNFARLRPRKETESNNDLRAVAEQRRLLKLEDARWEDGSEIAPDDFRAVLTMLEKHVRGWV